MSGKGSDHRITFICNMKKSFSCKQDKIIKRTSNSHCLWGDGRECCLSRVFWKKLKNEILTLGLKCFSVLFFSLLSISLFWERVELKDFLLMASLNLFIFCIIFKTLFTAKSNLQQAMHCLPSGLSMAVIIHFRLMHVNNAALCFIFPKWAGLCH